jgi:hypothetical protein
MDETAIANTALGRLGIGQAIANLTERSVPAQTCNRFYHQCRQEVLRAFPWPFAMSAVALAQEADQTYPGWGYVYAVPDNSLRIVSITDEAGIRWFRSGIYTAWNNGNSIVYDWSWLQNLRVPWQLALRTDGARQVIITDLTPAWALFVADVTNTGAMPPDFASVFADRLAMEVGGPLQAKREMVDRAEQRYGIWFSRAAATALNESRDDMRAESPSIACRS